MKNRPQSQGNPHEESLKQRLENKRIASIKGKATERFRDKKPTESLLPSYYVAKIGNFLMNVFSVVTGAFAFFYFLHDQFPSLPVSLSYGISGIFGLSMATMIQYAKHLSFGRIFPPLFKYNQIKKRASLVSLILTGISIGLSFYCCLVFHSFVNEVENLESLEHLAMDYDNKLSSIDSSIAIVTGGLTYQYGAKKGEVKTGASKLLRTLENNKATLVSEKKLALDEARKRNNKATNSHNEKQETKGYLLAWLSLLVELLCLPFLSGFTIYYEYLSTQEDENEPEPIPTTPVKSKEEFLKDLLANQKKNPSTLDDNNIFFRNNQSENNSKSPVITGLSQNYKLVVFHKKADGETVEMDKNKINVRTSDYIGRVGKKIAEIRLKGYSQKRMKELNNCFNQLDYWTQKQRELINLYDENLVRA